MDSRSIKLLIIAFILVGVIFVVVFFNISAKHNNLISAITSIPSTTTGIVTSAENNLIIRTLSNSSGNCLVNPKPDLGPSYRATTPNYQESMEIDVIVQDSTKVLCWTLNRNCYCLSNVCRKFSTSANKSYKWYEADQYCRGGNMTLLSLESEEEDWLIYHHIKSTPELNNEFYWTSGQRSLGWEWASGGSFSYRNWKTEPIKEAKNLTYLYLDTTLNFESGYWLETLDSHQLQLSGNFSFPGGMSFICESNNWPVHVSIT